MFSFFLNKQINPKPAFIVNPPNSVPKEILSNTNNSAITILLAQFGIKPTIEATNGDKYLFFSIKIKSVDSPIKQINVSKINVTIKT